MGSETPFLKVQFDGKKENSLIRKDFKLDPHFAIIKNREKRKDTRDFMTHILATAIVLTFLILIMHQVFFSEDLDNIPVYFISIVSTVVGFYFGGKLMGN